MASQPNKPAVMAARLPVQRTTSAPVECARVPGTFQTRQRSTAYCPRCSTYLTTAVSVRAATCLGSMACVPSAG
jgi:hypothetical protein